ncbi:hypothetical protein [Crassaminicella indica]|uniref:Uncharacterized protein n=1 Tax=Crassaminicella indica TaxID=2855394 RepID=A0ABX8REB5_9CLOT|nr:hypothetical protein [Crassaminicella indica]QXM07106.1 hypothetical protein KVH43_05205 [Crassaminicella indica]
MKACELKKIVKEILKTYKEELVDDGEILGEYISITHDEYEDIVPKGAFRKEDDEYLIMAVGTVETIEQELTVYLIYKYNDKAYYLTVVNEDEEIETYGVSIESWTHLV